MWYALLLLQALVLAQPQSECQQPTPAILGDQPTVLLGPHLQRLSDPDGSLTPEQVFRPSACSKFVAESRQPLPLLGSVSPTWYRFQLGMVGTQPEDWLLRVPARGLPEVCVHWPLRQGFLRHCADGSSAQGPYFLFDLPADIDTRQPVLVRISGGLVSPQPMVLSSRQAQVVSERRQVLATGVLFGLILAVVFLGGTAFAFRRRAESLYFSGFVLCCGLAVSGFLGRGLQWLSLPGQWLSTGAPPAFAAAGLALLTLFTRSSLAVNDDRRSPWNALCLSAIAAQALVILLAFGRPEVALGLLPVLGIGNLAVLLLLAGTWAWKGERQGRFLLVALAPFSLGAGAVAVGALADRPDWVERAMPLVTFGAVLMPVVLVVGLYHGYRRLTRERDNARGALLAEQRLALLRSSYCRLTGLPRRGRLAELFARLTHASSPDRIRIGLYLLHVDNLDEIRLRHGREVLEEVVSALAQRLRDGLDDDQLLGRLDNWELVVIVPTTTRDDDFRSRLYAAAERIADCVQAPLRIGPHTLEMSVSVGLSIWPLHGYAFDDLLKRCDSALYEAQVAGGNRFKVFSEEDHAARTDQFRRLQDLRSAIENDQFRLFHQPVHDADSGALVGLEALIRWQHPERGLVLPADFIPLAEESGLIQDVGYWVLEQAVDDLDRLQAMGFGHLPIALNVSPRQFTQPGFATHIGRFLSSREIDPSRLHLEITEDSLIDNMEQTRQALGLLRAAGVRVYVDDFGVGYSSLNYIRSLPIQGLKIDRSFVMNIGRTAQDEAVIGTIIRLARNLRLDLVAEGVESSYQRQFLRGLGCTRLQGHLFSEAMDRDRLVAYLQSQQAAAAG